MRLGTAGFSGKYFKKIDSGSRSYMEKWNKDCLRNMTNPLLGDTIKRVGAGPVGKFKADDRPAGPAVLLEFTAQHGIKKAVTHFCGLSDQIDLAELSADKYSEI